MNPDPNVLTLTDSQQVVLSITPTDKKGHPAPVESVTWQTSDATVLSVAPSDDGLSCLVKALDIGTAQVSVSADAHIGDGVSELNALLNVRVIAGEAAALAISVGTPSEQA